MRLLSSMWLIGRGLIGCNLVHFDVFLCACLRVFGVEQAGKGDSGRDFGCFLPWILLLRVAATIVRFWRVIAGRGGAGFVGVDVVWFVGVGEWCGDFRG